MRPKPDNRKNNVDRIQFNINKTIQNVEAAEEMIARTDNKKTIRDLEEKNERRREALHGMKEEIKEEAIDKKNGYK